MNKTRSAVAVFFGLLAALVFQMQDAHAQPAPKDISDCLSHNGYMHDAFCVWPTYDNMGRLLPHDDPRLTLVCNTIGHDVRIAFVNNDDQVGKAFLGWLWTPTGICQELQNDPDLWVRVQNPDNSDIYPTFSGAESGMVRTFRACRDASFGGDEIAGYSVSNYNCSYPENLQFQRVATDKSRWAIVLMR